MAKLLSVSAAKEPKVHYPPAFHGSRDSLRGFINQIKLIIWQKPLTYASDAQKVALVGQLLGGDALKWFNPLFERNDVLLTEFESFIKVLDDRFGDPNRQ